MKRNVSLLLFLVIAVTNLISQRESRLENMHFIPEGKMDDDPNMVVSFPSFWISDQITNKEFQEFWQYAKNRPNDELSWAELTHAPGDPYSSQPVVRSILFSELLKEIPDSTNWPVVNYFGSDQYADKPVIGVSEKLAAYYCIWKTTKVYDNLNEHERDPIYPYIVAPDLKIRYAQICRPELFSEDEVGFRIVIHQ
ncbi:SUMF1/EgtB/PvdO family nonheme iron enzyme [Natronoflexus pectinivorans]|uniref:Sulfatase-modifying factor enzyme 1 n=1 Tax=Natronoflexus pectinivorans TaxID=682526 RepID=A0A4R2GGE5_9BACT|nr:SUMF1/EgtB/PvdO family nonheme iron enzyme [Natronoflexus pectinivorans]TCO07294.1 sulfatase-modifying factor enzyme 1 [Natronoflexus pectinivorans]